MEKKEDKPKKRKKSSVSPTQRTLAYYKDLGYTCAITEHWNQWARIRQDLFGFCDVVAIREGETVCVQACAGASVAARVSKIEKHPNYPIVKSAGWKITVIGWRKVKVTRGGKDTKWSERIINL